MTLSFLIKQRTKWSPCSPSQNTGHPLCEHLVFLIRIAKWHADSLPLLGTTYFPPDGKAVNIFHTDSICSTKLELLNLGTTDILTLWGGWPVHCRRFSSTPGPYTPLGARSNPSCDDQKCPTFPAFTLMRTTVLIFKLRMTACFQEGNFPYFWHSAWHIVRYLINVLFSYFIILMS